MTNDNSRDYAIRVGGSQSYCSINKVQGNNVLDDSKRIAKEYSLYQNYPNPFNSSTKIRFDIPKCSHVTLKIYNILGIEVANIVDEDFSPGTQNIIFNATHLPSGLYFYQLNAGSFVRQNKMIITK